MVLKQRLKFLNLHLELFQTRSSNSPLSTLKEGQYSAILQITRIEQYCRPVFTVHIELYTFVCQSGKLNSLFAVPGPGDGGE